MRSVLASLGRVVVVVEEDLRTFRDQERQDAAALEHADVPHGLRAAVTERLVALSADGAAVVDAAAVLAVPATEALLTEMAGLDPDHGAQGLIDALDAAVLREIGTGRYGFRHVLAQQVAYRHVPGRRRIRLHRRAVEVFEAQDPAPLLQVAHHTLAAGDHETGWCAWNRRQESQWSRSAPCLNRSTRTMGVGIECPASEIR